MDISHTHKEYDAQLHFWKVVEDVMSDDERRLWKYLRKINPSDSSPENVTLNEQYRAAATWYGITSQTVNSLVGSIFRKWPAIEIPPAMDYLKRNADGTGASIYQLSQGACKGVLTLGRDGIYVGFPKTEGQVSRADIQSGRFVATISRIEAKQIINWRTTIQGSEVKLSLVVIEEIQEIPDGYQLKEVKRWRELYLEEGVYKERVWFEDAGGISLESEDTPKDAAGNPWRFIPFTFIGAETNDEKADKPPIWPLAMMNLKHYQNSADNEESTFFGVQNQPYINAPNLTSDDIKALQETGFYYGNRLVAPFPIGVASSPENTQVAKEMDRKIDAMQALGARLTASNLAAKTATQVQGEREGQTSILAMVASNVSEAYTQAIEWACLYMGERTEDVGYTLNQDFVTLGMDAPLLQSVMQGWERGAVPTADYVRFMKRIELFDDEMDEADYDELLNANRMIE